jgi:RPN1 N-terminal domain
VTIRKGVVECSRCAIFIISVALIISLLSWIEDRESLKFKLSGAKDYDTLALMGAEPKHFAEDNLGGWGHEFVRSLAGEIGQEYNQRVLDGVEPENDEALEDLLKFVHVIVPFHLTHNAEAEAIDLLIEVQRLKYLLELDTIHEDNYQRICLYLIKTASYMSDPDDLMVRCNRVVVLLRICRQTAILTRDFLRLYFTVRKCLRRHMKFFEDNRSILMPYWLLSE